MGEKRPFPHPTWHLETPVFAPVGTAATVKAMKPSDLQAMGASLVLSNTYHLYLRPGDELIRDLGGLHSFMNWDGPLLTDSGGFQVFSLSDARKIDADGVASALTSTVLPTALRPNAASPSRKTWALTSSWPSTNARRRTTAPMSKNPLTRTHPWLERCLAAKTRPDQALFGIVQGGAFLIYEKPAPAS
ncbi:MAG: tRNA-guanine transglycosylase [Chloroflexi bacterium]|nr:tRNA-guanine transglycosylase [Chloroflexota bacterium]